MFGDSKTSLAGGMNGKNLPYVSYWMRRRPCRGMLCSLEYGYSVVVCHSLLSSLAKILHLYLRAERGIKCSTWGARGMQGRGTTGGLSYVQRFGGWTERTVANACPLSALSSDFDSREACQKLEVEADISALLAGKMNQVFWKLSFLFFKSTKGRKGMAVNRKQQARFWLAQPEQCHKGVFVSNTQSLKLWALKSWILLVSFNCSKEKCVRRS